mgnify:CR=1 FL=1
MTISSCFGVGAPIDIFCGLNGVDLETLLFPLREKREQ